MSSVRERKHGGKKHPKHKHFVLTSVGQTSSLVLGNEVFQPKVFLTKVLGTPLGGGRPRLQVMDVRAKMLVFQDFDRPDRSFGPGYPRE